MWDSFCDICVGILSLHVLVFAFLTMCIWNLTEPSQSLSKIQQPYLMLSIFKENNAFGEYQ
jgi:hypothetical protein